MCQCCDLGTERCPDQYSVKLGMNIHSGQLHVEFFSDIRGYRSEGVRKVMVI